MLFDAKTLTAGWLTVGLASGDSDEHSTLHRTVLCEFYPHGVRLVATDSFKLLHSWIPDITDSLNPEPFLDDAPDTVLVAQDIDFRARAFLSFMWQLATGKDAPDYEIRLTPTRTVDEGQFEDMATATLIIERPDHERIILRSVEAPFPNWRHLVAEHKPSKVPHVALTPAVIKNLCKAEKWHPDSKILWSFGGSDRPARIEFHDSDPHIEGLVCPSRWPWADKGGE